LEHAQLTGMELESFFHTLARMCYIVCSEFSYSISLLSLFMYPHQNYLNS